jgi:hypothetical protein
VLKVATRRQNWDKTDELNIAPGFNQVQEQHVRCKYWKTTLAHLHKKYKKVPPFLKYRKPNKHLTFSHWFFVYIIPDNALMYARLSLVFAVCKM